jgi:hypothetical protein
LLQNQQEWLVGIEYLDSEIGGTHSNVPDCWKLAARRQLQDNHLQRCDGPQLETTIFRDGPSTHRAIRVEEQPESGGPGVRSDGRIQVVPAWRVVEVGEERTAFRSVLPEANPGRAPLDTPILEIDSIEGCCIEWFHGYDDAGCMVLGTQPECGLSGHLRDRGEQAYLFGSSLVVTVAVSYRAYGARINRLWR